MSSSAITCPYNLATGYLLPSKEKEKEEEDAPNQRAEITMKEPLPVTQLSDKVFSIPFLTIGPQETHIIQLSPRTAQNFKEALETGEITIRIEKSTSQPPIDETVTQPLTVIKPLIDIEPLDVQEMDAFFAREEKAYEEKKKEHIRRITQLPETTYSSTAGLERIRQILSLAEQNKIDTPVYRLEDLLSQLTNRELENIHFGPTLDEGLKREMKEKQCDVITALKILETRHEETLKALKQIGQDIWRSTMVIVSPNGLPMLISLAEFGAKNWQELAYPKMGFPNLKYGYQDAARDIGLADADLSETQMAGYIVRTLDHYLSSEARFTFLGKLKICNKFHQGLLGAVNPTNVTPEFLERVKRPNIHASSSEKEKQQDLKERYEAYCLAHWLAGCMLPPSVEPGSDLDVAGFANYANAQEIPYIKFKKTVLLTLDLKVRAVMGNYLVHFTNPFNQKPETRHYHVQFDYGKTGADQKRFLQIRPLEEFFDLRKCLLFPKFCNWRGPTA